MLIGLGAWPGCVTREHRELREAREAYEASIKAFPGEAGGYLRLGSMISNDANQTSGGRGEKAEKLRNTMSSALTYPIFLVFFSGAVVVFILVGINQLICQWVQNLEGVSTLPVFFLLPAFSSAILWPVVLHFLRQLRRYYRVN